MGEVVAGPSTPLPRDKKEDSQGSPTGVELFSEEETAQSGTTYMVDTLERKDSPIETRFTLFVYNYKTMTVTEVCGSSEDDVQVEEGDSEDDDEVVANWKDDGSEDEDEWNMTRETMASLALLVALESTDMLMAVTEVAKLAEEADILRTKKKADEAHETEAYIQWTRAAKLEETMVSLAEKANADESVKATADGAKMVAAETQEQMAAEPRARAAEDHAHPAVAPPKPMDSDRRGMGVETKALLAQRARAAATVALEAFKANAEAKAALANKVGAEASALTMVAEVATESTGITFVLDVEGACGVSSTVVEVGRQEAIDGPSTDGGKVASERLISDDRLDNLSSSTAGRLKEDARTLVWHNYFFRSMDLTTHSTKEPDENESINVRSGEIQAVYGEMLKDERVEVAASFSHFDEVCKLRMRVACLEEKLGVAEMELEESVLAFSDVWEDASLWRRQQKELAENPLRKRAMLPFLPRKDDWICLACDWRNFGSAERCPKCGRPKSWYPICPAGDQPSRGGGGGWESEVAARMQGCWGGAEEEDAGCGWDQEGWGDDEAGEADSSGWDQYS